MIKLLSSLTIFFPLLVELLGLMLKKMDASAQEKEAFQNLYKAAQASGNLPVRVSDKLSSQWAEIDEEIRKENEKNSVDRK